MSRSDVVLVMGADDQSQGESASQYRTLLETSTDGVFINVRGLIHYANPALQRLLGASSSEDLVGRRVFDMIDPDSHEVVRARIRAVEISSGPLPPLEEKYVRLDGRRVDVEVTAVAIVQDGQHASLVTVRDISERKKAERARRRLEDQLRHSQKMEALGTLAGGVAHDFNNILSAIVGNAELAALKLTDKHPAKRHVEEILTAAARAKGLTRQVLAFSTQQPPRLEVLDLCETVVEELSLLRAAVPLGVTLEERLLPTHDCSILADSTQIHQVLLNLCTNAWQAAGPNGKVTVSVERTRLPNTDSQEREYAALLVQDNGSGIDPAIKGRIFDPFFTTKPPGYGTGLGLSVVHGIARTHEAQVTCHTQVGVGTTFGVHFPIVSAAGVTTSPQSTTIPRGNGQAILLVDDEPQLINVTTQILVGQGYRVTGFTLPEEALRALRAGDQRFDLLVTDLKMPTIMGLELAKRARELVPGLPVILISGFLGDDARSLDPSLGICCVLHKPVDSSELCGAIASTLGL